MQDIIVSRALTVKTTEPREFAPLVSCYIELTQMTRQLRARNEKRHAVRRSNWTEICKT